jgi:hypothetical protein
MRCQELAGVRHSVARMTQGGMSDVRRANSTEGGGCYSSVASQTVPCCSPLNAQQHSIGVASTPCKLCLNHRV